MDHAWLPFNCFLVRPSDESGSVEDPPPNLAEVFNFFTAEDPDILSVIHIRLYARRDPEFRRDIGMLYALLKTKGIAMSEKVWLFIVEMRLIRKHVLTFETA